MSELIDKLKRTARLPTPPGAAAQILKLSQECDISLNDVANTLAADPALSLRILKYANSALVGVSREVTSVRDAVVLLGMRTVRMMALSFSLVTADDRRACPGFDYNQFWSHSLAHAVAARYIAKRTNVISPPEEAFAAGMLASVGKLVFAVAMPNEYAAVLAKVGGSLGDTAPLEREQFGADYREAGGELLAEWGIPARLSETVKHQGKTDLSAVPASLWPIVNLLDDSGLYVDIICSHTPDDQIDELLAALSSNLSIQRSTAVADDTTDCLRDIVLCMRQEFKEIATLLALDRSAELNVSAIQAEAGEALSELSLAAHMQHEAVKRENKGLQVKAWTDGLTGISNRAAFDIRFEALWQEALNNHRPIGLAIIDIDHFKRFNDGFGHRTGDAVLKAVANCLPDCIREVDFLARFGGEEFAVIMPNTDRLVAAGICVSLRRAINQLTVHFEGKQHHVTISLGAAILPSPNRMYTPQLLIESADQQLYRSKDKGRNCCSMRELPRTPEHATVAVGR